MSCEDSTSSVSAGYRIGGHYYNNNTRNNVCSKEGSVFYEVHSMCIDTKEQVYQTGRPGGHNMHCSEHCTDLAQCIIRTTPNRVRSVWVASSVHAGLPSTGKWLFHPKPITNHPLHNKLHPYEPHPPLRCWSLLTSPAAAACLPWGHAPPQQPSWECQQ